MSGISPALWQQLQPLLRQPDPWARIAQQLDAMPTSYYERNKAWLKEGAGDNYATKLEGDKEKEFLQWIQKNNVPFNPTETNADYDMRGFWQALQSGDPRAASAVNPNDEQMHYPDYWKTPYHESFSAESQWADPKKAPIWNDSDQLVLPSGDVVFDEKAKAAGKK